MAIPGTSRSQRLPTVRYLRALRGGAAERDAEEGGAEAGGAATPPRVRDAFLAVTAWLLAVSLDYETYLLLRDGHLPPTTWSNLVTSTAAFAAAGLFWSLTFDSKRGVLFAFMIPAWPRGEEPSRVSASMVALGIVFATVIGLMLLPFVLAR